MERREFIKLSAGSAVALTGAIGIEACEGRSIEGALKGEIFSPGEAATLSVVASRIVAPLDAQELNIGPKIASLLAAADDQTQWELRQLLLLFGSVLGSLVFEGRLLPFISLGTEAQDEVLASWRDSRLAFRRSGFQALQRLCLAVAYATPSLYPAIGYPGPPFLVRPDGVTVGGPPPP